MIHFKYWKNILISRFYEQFSRNGFSMAPERLFEKISNFKNVNILYIILKNVVWRFRIYNYFREIFKSRDFMNTLRNLAKSVLLIISRHLNMLYTILKHVVWRFRIYNYFREIFKCRENMSKTDFAKFLKVFIKSRNLNISRK